jgi:YD repeat-containing protein
MTDASGSTKYYYDSMGRAKLVTMTADGTRTITYDYDSMPSSITLGSNTTTFTYDGSGARVKKTASVETVYIGKLYECTVGSCVKYIYAGGQKVTHKIAGTNDTVYYHPDHLGSTSVISDSTGANIGNMQYAPFGEARMMRPAAISRERRRD